MEGPGAQEAAARQHEQQHKQQEQQDACAAPATFIASPTFTGAREGYVFTSGDKGTGYYRDALLHAPEKPGAAATAAAAVAVAPAKGKPVVLKSSSIVKGLQRRPGVQPDAKKRKTEPAGAADAAKPSTYQKEMERYRAMNCGADTQHDRPLVK